MEAKKWGRLAGRQELNALSFVDVIKKEKNETRIQRQNTKKMASVMKNKTHLKQSIFFIHTNLIRYITTVWSINI